MEFFSLTPSADWMSQQFLNINNKSSLHINGFPKPRQAVHVKYVCPPAGETESRLFLPAFSVGGFPALSANRGDLPFKNVN